MNGNRHGTALGVLLVSLLSVPIMTILVVYDVVGALGPFLEERGVADVEYMGYLYVAYSTLPPVFCIVGGVIIDKFGTPAALVVALVPMLAASLMVWFSNDSYSMLISARVLQGFQEILFPITYRELGMLFTDSWLSVSFAVTNVFGQLGSAFTFLLLPVVASENWFAALGTSFYAVCCAIFASLTYVLLNRHYQFYDTKESKDGSHAMKLSDIKEFTIVYWCINVINCLSTCSAYIEMSFGPSFLFDKGFDRETAGLVISMMNFMIVLAPFTSWGIEKLGWRCEIWLSCCALMCFGFFMLAFEMWSPVIWLMVIAFAFTVLNSSINASVVTVVKPKVLGTAYGLIGVVFNLGLVVYPFVIGTLAQKSGDWKYGHFVFGGTNFFAFFCALVILVQERKQPVFTASPKILEYELIEGERED